jgi:hypothetical protein
MTPRPTHATIVERLEFRIGQFGVERSSILNAEDHDARCLVQPGSLIRGSDSAVPYSLTALHVAKRGASVSTMGHGHVCFKHTTFQTARQN